MFSISEDYAKAHYDYTRERLGVGPCRRVDVERPERRRPGWFAALFTRHHLQPSLPDC